MRVRPAAVPLLTLAGLLAAGPGCVWYGPHSMTRVWGDRNSLDRPALFVERLSHAPPPRERVERFRWQYGVGPGVPFVAPETELVVAAPPADGGGESSTPAVPPAPPAAEPAPTGDAQAAKPKAQMAWLFTPARG